MTLRVAILVDGAFYRKRANALKGFKSPQDRANELETYCYDHLKDDKYDTYLSRVFIMIAIQARKMYIIL